MSRELQELAGLVWGPLGANDAADLYKLSSHVGQHELGLRLRALARRVIKGDVDPISAAAWLARQRARHGADP